MICEGFEMGTFYFSVSKNYRSNADQKKNRFLLQQQKDEMGQKDPYTQVHVTKEKYLLIRFL